MSHDRRGKKLARIKHPFELLKIALTGLFIFVPVYLYALFTNFFRHKPHLIDDVFGLVVDHRFDSKYLVEDLGVRKISIRVALWQLDELPKLKSFADDFKDYEILFVLMPSRDLIENTQALKQALDLTIKSLLDLSKNFKYAIGINRYKWGYHVPKEYLRDLQILSQMRKKYDIFLYASSVMDYEFLILARTLFNNFRFRQDYCAIELYVDRRGAPTNTQGGLDLNAKVNFAHALSLLSPKTINKKIIISEFNWPIKDTQPYMPTSNDEAVDHATQAQYLLQYFLIIIASNKIETAYWHQLVSPCFGLVDLDNNKHPSFLTMQFLVSKLKGTKFLNIHKSQKKWCFIYENKAGKKGEIIWSTEQIRLDKKHRYYKITGEEIDINISSVDEPIYKEEI